MKVKTLNGNLNIVGNNLRKYRKQKKFHNLKYVENLIYLVLPCIIVIFMKLNMERKLLRTLKL